MGMSTTVYGYIEEMDFWEEPIRSKVRMHNSHVISLVPLADSWPPVSQEMIATCQNNEPLVGPNLEYRGRIIHFGANLKYLELDWQEWKSKFEKVLSDLYFAHATVHFKPEYASIQTNVWSVDILKYQIMHDGKMPDQISRDTWIYESTWEQ